MYCTCFLHFSFSCILLLIVTFLWDTVEAYKGHVGFFLHFCFICFTQTTLSRVIIQLYIHFAHLFYHLFYILTVHMTVSVSLRLLWILFCSIDVLPCKFIPGVSALSERNMSSLSACGSDRSCLICTNDDLTGGAEWPWRYCSICGQQGTYQDAPVKVTACIICSECNDVRWDVASTIGRVPAHSCLSAATPVHGTL